MSHSESRFIDPLVQARAEVPCRVSQKEQGVFQYFGDSRVLIRPDEKEGAYITCEADYRDGENRETVYLDHERLLALHSFLGKILTERILKKGASR